MDEDQMEEEAEVAVLEELDRELVHEPEEIEEVLDDRPMKVHEGLFIGSCMAEMNKSGLLRAGVTDILQVAQGLFPHHPLVFNYMNIQVQDIPSEDLVRFFPKCFEFIDRAVSTGGAVLVHCVAGVSRSATVVLGYLMSRCNMRLTAAVHHLKDIRPWVAPNLGFMEQLAAYEGLAHDMSRWRAWHSVWSERMQQQQQQQLQPKQQWLQIPQVHACGSQQPSSHRDNSCDGGGIGSSTCLSTAVVDLPPGQGSSACQPSNGSSNTSPCATHHIQSCVQCSNGFCGPFRILCDGTAATGGSVALSVQQQQQAGSSKWQYKYSSSAPELGHTLASASCTTGVDGVGTSISDATAGRHSGMKEQACSYSSGSGSCLGFGQAWRDCAQHVQRQDPLQAAEGRPMKRHVAFVLDDRAQCDAAAAAVLEEHADMEMEDTMLRTSAP